MNATMLTAPAIGAKDPLAVSIGAPRAKGMVGTPVYEAASTTSQELACWYPSLMSADREVLPARDRIVARSRWLERNNGWAQGGVEKRVDAVVGSNIWLRARPDFAALGQTAEWADKWASQVESQFRLWANSVRLLCDVERHLHFGGLVRLAYQHFVLDGEACAAMYMLERGGMFSTSVLVLDPDRLSNPNGRSDDRFLRGGVQLDEQGAAVGYWIRNAHQSDFGAGMESSRFTFVPRESKTGRPLFIHVFNKKRAHMRRGIGRFASVMAKMKMLDRADQAEIQQAVISSIFGLYAKTTRSSDELRQSLAPAGDDDDELDNYRADFYEQSDIKLGGARIAVVPEGDELATVETKHPSSNYSVFQRNVLNSIAAALGVSGEQLSNEWAGINYSNARTLLNEIWRGFLNERHTFTTSFCTPIFAAWLEEAVARDLIEVPGGKGMFYVFRDALCQCDWIGPGRGYIDPKKEMEATSLRIGGFISNLPDEAADQGYDWHDNFWQAKRVQEAKKLYGLDEPPPPQQQGGNANSAGGNDNADAQDQQDRQEAAGATR